MGDELRDAQTVGLVIEGCRLRWIPPESIVNLSDVQGTELLECLKVLWSLGLVLKILVYMIIVNDNSDHSSCYKRQ